LKGNKPSNVFIYGRCGTGKTVVTRMVGKELENVSKDKNKELKVVYVNCKMKRVADTEYRILATLLKEFGKEVPFTGLPTDQIYNTFFEVIDSKRQDIIIILDEVDSLIYKVGDELLYNLIRANQELKNAKITIVGITNDLNLIENLDPRVKSSLGEEELVFPPYNALQLQDILRNRAELAFISGALEEGVIEKCAALAAQEHGDARKALDLLRVAGELSERDGSKKITLRHVDIAEEKIDLDRVMEVVKAQPKQSQAVLYSILELFDKNKKEIQTGEALDKYSEVCQKYGLKVLTQRRVSDLISELDLFGIINTKIISKGRYGRTRIITISLPDVVQKRLKSFLCQIFL
jgi:cell division control protein 6